jgi:hypothetical protein
VGTARVVLGARASRGLSTSDGAPSPADRTGVAGGVSGVLLVRSAFQCAHADGSVHKFRAADSAWERRANLPAFSLVSRSVQNRESPYLKI